MRDYILALVGSVVMTGYVMVIFDVGLVRPTVSSVREILAAIDRVQHGEMTGRVPITSVDEFGDLAVAFNDMQEAMREREYLRAAFGSYVDPTLAQRLLTQGDSIFEGEEVDVTVFFIDVRGFTTYMEGVSAPEAVARLNRLFEIVVPIISAAGGHANHYLGDGLLAVFGTPSPLKRHADKAVGAAIEIYRQVQREFKGEMRIGIGINTGPVIAGTIGGAGRYEFTVIGDTVNVASRVESMTKETGDAILMTRATIDAMRSAPCMKTVDRGEIELRGKSTRVCVHACIATAEAPVKF
jgi:class 3 adenylate cyclase